MFFSYSSSNLLSMRAGKNSAPAYLPALFWRPAPWRRRNWQRLPASDGAVFMPPSLPTLLRRSATLLHEASTTPEQQYYFCAACTQRGVGAVTLRRS